MKKKKTYLGIAPDLTVFSEIGRFEWDGATWVVFLKKGTDWQNFKVMLLNGRRVKANYTLGWSKFRGEFADNSDREIMLEHSPGLYDNILSIAKKQFPIA